MKFLLFITFLFPIIILSQNQSFDRQNEKIKKMCEHFIKQNDIPGMSVSISYMGNIIFSKGFGYSDIENEIEVDPSKTKFRIASITKVITALTLMKLHELDSLNIDNTPDFYLDSLPTKKNNFSIRQLAGHISGLKRNPSEEKWDENNKYTQKDFYRVYKKDELDFEPGSQYQYSNYGFKLIGLVIEKKCAKAITDCQDYYVMQKLNMKNTFPEDESQHSDIAKFYLKKNGKLEMVPFMDCKFKHSQGCHFSTSEDLLKLGSSFLNPLLLFNTIRPIQMMIKQQTLISGIKTGYGIGVITNFDIYGNYFWGHSGMENGSRSIIRIYPKYKLIITILINNQQPSLEDLVTEISYEYIERINNL